MSGARQAAWLLRLKGLVMVGVLAAFVAGAVASYQKTFVPSVDVTVLTARAGLQLPVNGDVRMRGALVGRITGISTTGRGVAISLALDPDAASHVPDDATARILPTTLFGQKYVELVGRDSDGPAVADGATLREDTSRRAVEVTNVIDHLEPLLRAVRPQQLAETLQSLADGLRGRGEQLGRTAVALDSYLARLNLDLPALATDLRLLGVVAKTYGAATPDVLALLRNATATGDTVLDNRRALADFQAQLTRFARVTRRFLDVNGDGLVRLTARTRPVLELLGRYSPEFPCLFAGLLAAESVAGQAFRDGVFHADVALGKQYPGYTADDLPRFGDLGAGPHCAGLPTVPLPVGAAHSADGADYPPGSLLPPLGSGS